MDQSPGMHTKGVSRRTEANPERYTNPGNQSLDPAVRIDTAGNNRIQQDIEKYLLYACNVRLTILY